MSIDDETFFSENLANINRMVSKILIATIPVPICFIALSNMGIFAIGSAFSLRVLALSIIIALVFQILIRTKVNPEFTMCVGLVGIDLFIALIGTHANVGVYIAFGIAPIISCLYYNRKLTNIITLVSYVCMAISLLFKYQNGAAIFNRAVCPTFVSAYIPILAGFTIEFSFIFLITNLMVRRGYGTLKHLLMLIDDRNGLIENLREKQSKLSDMQQKIIEFVAESLKNHDLLTGFHVEHTQTYVRLISHKLRSLGYYTKELTDETINLYSDAAFLHDIGKIHTPEGILNKPGKFTDEEFAIMKRHPMDGANLIKMLPVIGNGEFNKVAYEIALYHHEKWDGTGYPNRVGGTKIPLCARIMAAADVIDALISLRTYKKPMPIEKAMSIFESQKGTQFEPSIVDAVIACKDAIQKKDAAFKENESFEFNREVQDKHQYNELLKIQILEQLIDDCDSQETRKFQEEYLQKLKQEYTEKYDKTDIYG